jgi:ribosomal protein S18 acetylase RimI-like enzyme
MNTSMKKSDDLVIREYLPADKEEVLNLHRLAMEAIGVYRHEPHWNEDLDTIETTYGEGRGLFLVGTTGHKIVAMGAYKKNSPDEAEIMRMRVLPGMQKKGFGKRIYAELEKQAIASGIQRFFLETSVLQDSANDLYRSAGFIETRRVVIDGYDCIVYEKKLFLPEKQNRGK